MSDAMIALLACPDDPDRPEPSMDWFPSGYDPGVRCYLASTIKTSAPKGIQVLNLSTNYPAALARIESMAAVTGARQMGLPHAATGLMFFSLQQLMRTWPDVSRVVLLRAAFAADPGSLAAAFSEMDGPFTLLDENSACILYDRHSEGAELALAMAMDAVMSGAIYGLAADELPAFLNQLGGAVRSPALAGLAPSVAVQTAQSQDTDYPSTHAVSF